MTQTFTLAHLTDVHLPARAGMPLRFWNTKRVLGYLNWQRGRRAVHQQAVADRLIADALAIRADHFVITGNVINLGLPQEYSDAVSWLNTISPADAVTVVPGNHDIYSALHGDIGVGRWAAYMGCESETLAFPFVRRVGPLALIGLNSAVETPPFIARGRLGAQQIDVVRELLDRLAGEDVVRVVLIHHPPLPGMARERRRLEDAAHFARVLESCGAELVLYGHNHTPQLTWFTARDGAVPVIGGASASAAIAHKDEPLARYNLFTFFKHENGLRIRQAVRGLETPDGPVVKLSETVLTPPEPIT
jgi:3',5'-cyclic AMP phosphodiesterase CpdA